MRVLIVAPEVAGLPALAQNNELTRIGDHPAIQVDPLIGPLVTSDRVSSRLTGAGRRYDAVLVSAHGRPGHVVLADCTVEAQWLTSLLRRAGVPLLVLAVCSSAVRPEGGPAFPDVVPAAGINLVAMSVAVADLAAVEYDVALFHALANGESLRQAHLIALEVMAGRAGDAVAPQLFMADPGQAPAAVESRKEVPPMAPTYDDSGRHSIEATLRRMDEKLDRLTETVYQIDGRLRALEKEVERRHGVSPEVPQPVLILGAAGVVLTLLLLIFVSWRLL